MILLAIESSCDETAVAVVKDGREVLGQRIASQMKAHRRYGGVVPEIASRMHTEIIHTLIDEVLTETQLKFTDFDACAVTAEPGLEGGLLVGLAVGKTIAAVLGIPLIKVNHLHGHIYAHFLTDNVPSFPFIALIASGGHTQLVKMTGHYEFELLGETRDDAAGEAFDKVARYLGLGYPGGPEVEKQALSGDPKAFSFPRGLKQSPFEFSFSGLKTAVMQTVSGMETPPVADVCASFQQSVADTLVSKSVKACETFGCKTLVVCGGVMANGMITEEFRRVCGQKNIQFHTLPKVLCTDNAAMIGAAGFYAGT